MEALLQSSLPGEFYGQNSLVGYSPWGRKESDMNKQLTTKADIPTAFFGNQKYSKSLSTTLTLFPFSTHPSS